MLPSKWYWLHSQPQKKERTKAGSFDLDSDTPTIRVDAAFSKRRRTDVRPIRADLADVVRSWLDTKPVDEPEFSLPDNAWKMLHQDLAVAREQWLEEARSDVDHQDRENSDFLKLDDASRSVADFHSLRHEFSSSIVNSGASVKVAQELARHSTPVLAFGRYSHARLNELTGALNKLTTPELKPAPEQQRIRATGTYNVAPSAARKHPQQIPQ